MDVVRGRRDTPAADRELTAELLARAATEDVAAVRVWTPHRQLAFGRRDATRDRYSRACALAREHGYQPIERRVGGRAVAYTGTTLAFAVAVPTADARGGIDERYEAARTVVREALVDRGAALGDGEPAASFCPGAHSIRVTGGGKVAGIAQRVRRDAALVAGCLVVTDDDADAIGAVLDPVYRTLDVAFDPASVGSVATAGGPRDVGAVARAVESAFVGGPWGDGRRNVRRVGSTI